MEAMFYQQKRNKKKNKDSDKQYWWDFFDLTNFASLFDTQAEDIITSRRTSDDEGAVGEDVDSPATTVSPKLQIYNSLVTKFGNCKPSEKSFMFQHAVYSLILALDSPATTGTFNTNNTQERIPDIMSSVMGVTLHNRTHWNTEKVFISRLQDSSDGGSLDENKDGTYSSDSDSGDHDEGKKCQASGAETNDGKNSENTENQKDNHEIDDVNATIATNEGDENSKNTEEDVVSEIKEQIENVIDEGVNRTENVIAPEDDAVGITAAIGAATTPPATTPPAIAIATKKRKLDKAVDEPQTRKSNRSQTRK